MLQLALIASYGGQTNAVTGAFVPVQIESATIMKTEEFEGLAVSTGEPKGLRSLYASAWLQSTSGESIVALKNVRFVAYGGEMATDSTENVQPFNRIVWKPDASVLGPAQVEKIFAPQSVKVADTLWDKLDHLSTNMLLLFARRNPELVNGSFTPKTEDMKRFLEWVIYSVNYALQGKSKWGASNRSISDEALEKDTKDLRESLEPSSPEARIITRIADSFPQIFREELTGMSLILEDGLLTQLYESTSAIDAVYKHLEKVVDLMAHTNGKMNIMEIGGGTGGATRRVLPVLSPEDGSKRFSKYVFTDVTPTFLNPAKENFEKYDGIEYRLFDMETELEEQSAETLEGQFDLVISSQVRSVVSICTDSMHLTNHVL